MKIYKWPDLPYSSSPIDSSVRIDHEFTVQKRPGSAAARPGLFVTVNAQKGQMRGQKRPRPRPSPEVVSAAARPGLFLTVNASRPKCGTNAIPGSGNTYDHRDIIGYDVIIPRSSSIGVLTSFFFSSVEITKFVRVNYWQKLKIITFLFELSFHLRLVLFYSNFRRSTSVRYI